MWLSFFAESNKERSHIIDKLTLFIYSYLNSSTVILIKRQPDVTNGTVSIMLCNKLLKTNQKYIFVFKLKATIIRAETSSFAPLNKTCHMTSVNEHDSVHFMHPRGMSRIITLPLQQQQKQKWMQQKILVNRRCIDVVATLYKRHVPAGFADILDNLTYAGNVVKLRTALETIIQE